MEKQEQIRAIAEHYGLTRNSDFARFFGISEQAAYQQQKQGIIKYEEVYRRCPDLSPDWLLNGGEGPMLRAERIKTGQPISIGVPAEALAIIGRHKGRTHLLDVYDRCSSYKSFQHRMNVSLKTVGMLYNPRSKVWEGEPLQPGISYYWMRYSWATVAAELDIPERTIGAALAHSTARTVTSIYTRVDMRKKIDAANRAVIDHIFGGTCILGFNSVP